MKKLMMVLAMAISLVSCQSQKGSLDKEVFKSLEDGVYANMQTTMGDMLIKLEADKAPMTVGNFVALAEGTHKEAKEKQGLPFYEGLTFHRVIKGFMIQGGDHTGTGAGNAGYDFADEFHDDLVHSDKGILSMANSGPATNGTQFFITHGPTPHLNARHSVFGKVVKGLDIVDSIANVKTAQQNKPVIPVVINRVEIIRKGKEYKNYIAYDAYLDGKKAVGAKKAQAEAKKAKEKEDCLALIKEIEPKATTTASGLKYFIHTEGTGAVPTKGEQVQVHYDLKLADCNIIDSSFKRGEPIKVEVGEGKVIKGWDEALMTLKKGTKATLIIPAKLGYGERGAGGVIPPNSTLYFDVEILDNK